MPKDHAPPPAQKDDGTPSASTGGLTVAAEVATGLGIFMFVVAAIFAFVFHLGAAMLSYSKYQSIGWAIIDFLFAGLYYPFFALVLNTPPAPVSMFGGARKLMKKWL